LRATGTFHFFTVDSASEQLLISAKCDFMQINRCAAADPSRIVLREYSRSYLPHFAMRKASLDAAFKPRHPLLSAMGFRATLPIAECFFRHKHIYRSNSHFAAERSLKLIANVARGETVYLAGISIGGFHNTGAALVEVTAAGGLQIICNNEEERFARSAKRDHEGFGHRPRSDRRMARDL
jgi:hypothetical protein